MKNIKDTIQERSSEYGNYSGQSTISQALKNVMRSSKNWSTLTHDKKESLEMIVHKIARIINGNSNNFDSWHDIEGYAALISNSLQKPKKLTDCQKSQAEQVVNNPEKDYHWCDYTCTEPNCIKSQRDELSKKYIARITNEELSELLRTFKQI